MAYLWLYDNDLTGKIPPQFGNLANLYGLALYNNDLTGAIPSELGNLTSLGWLRLDDNILTGAIPPELGNLTNLRSLYLSGNAGLSGALPGSLLALSTLETLYTGGTSLCAPADPAFLAWLGNVGTQRVRRCTAATVYLTQAVQSREFPVPLVADEDALLRVFVTAANPDAANMPPVRARFYLEGAEAHLAEIQGRPHPIPTEVDEGHLEMSANAMIPGTVVRPELEMVIEVDPEGTLDPSLGVTRRIPAEGRLAVDVREMPLFDLTVIPFLLMDNMDLAVLDYTEGMATDRQDHDLLQQTADLLPVGDMRVTSHASVVTSTDNPYALLNQTEAIRIMEGGTGHFMGLITGRGSGSLVTGVANLGGRASFARPQAGIIAHELGHNFSLRHAPCGPFSGPSDADPYFPDRYGRIGAWGYAGRTLPELRVSKGQLVSPVVPDLMSYCGPPDWISDYHFTKALRYRLEDEGTPPPRMAAAPVQVLLVWGGVDSTGTPYLEPAFIVDAPPALPDPGGDYELAGWDTDGGALFSLAFDIPPMADATDGAGSFAFALPASPAWAGRLAGLTLSGLGGTATLDANTDRPMSIYRDQQTGQVRAVLRGELASTDPGPDGLAAPRVDVITSDGIPPADAWGR